MRRPIRALFPAAVLLALVACDGGGPTEAARSAEGVTVKRDGTANATAVGAVTFTFGSSTETLSFVVSNNGSSVTSGTGLFYAHVADVVAAVNITCLHVSGTNPRTATFLGTIVESSDPNIEGDDAYWQVQDGSTDYASLVSLADAGLGPHCTTPGEFDLVAVSKGSITITS